MIFIILVIAASRVDYSQLTDGERVLIIRHSDGHRRHPGLSEYLAQQLSFTQRHR